VLIDILLVFTLAKVFFLQLICSSSLCNHFRSLTCRVLLGHGLQGLQVLGEKLSNLSVAFAFCQAQSSYTHCAFMGRVCATLQQQLAHLEITIAGSFDQWRLARKVSCIRICPCLQQLAHWAKPWACWRSIARAFHGSTACEHQWCFAQQVPRIDLRAELQEQSHSCKNAIAGGRHHS